MCILENRFNGKHIVVLGLGKSGVATAKLLQSLGAYVVVNDSKPYEQVEDEVKELQSLGVQVIVGSHPMELINESVDLLVKNPGIPYTVHPVMEAEKAKIPVITEIELASSLVPAEYIGITGSNGKTTTTALTGEILKNAELQPIIGGNIGIPLSEIVSTQSEHMLNHPVVLELSSFQLQGTVEFRPHIAAILNMYQTHLDYHKTMEQYTEAKSKIFLNQRREDFLVLNADQRIFESYYSKIQSNIVWCSKRNAKQIGVTVDNNEIVYRTEERKIPICCVQEIGIPGEHNVENALFATAISLLKNVSPEIIRSTLRDFRGVEHRLELVGEFNQVKYYNDSKATNQQATIKALQSFANPVILIAGGLDRGNEFDEIVESLSLHVKSLIVYGQTARKLIKAGEKAGIKQIFNVNNLEEAVQVASQISIPKDAIVLSPACASWDMFSSFEERGKLYKQYVLENNI